ncbi:MAG: TlpA disulfide reductase family protein [Phycisphaerales bacterium]
MKQSTQYLCAAAGSLALLGAAIGMGPGVAREGTSEHVESLKAIEAQAFDTELFAGLDGWTLGQALDAESIAGKVVLVAMVASGDPQSMMTLSSLDRFQRQHADDGLVVLAVHPELGWDGLMEQVKAGNVKVQVARDVGGAFARGVLADDYPDMYLIDRAGQLRFADVKNRSLKPALSFLLGETPDEAIANAEKQANGIEVAIEPPKKERSSIPPAKYAKADWPAMNMGKLNAKNYQGKQLPVPLGKEKWISKKRDLEGKVIVLDFWATWCGPCKRASPGLDALQKQFKGKLEVLAIGGQSDPESKVRQYATKHHVSYAHLYDKNQSIYRELEIHAIPHSVVMSTDGVIRWQGNPLSPAFKKAVAQVIAQDPMFADD